jgi:flagellar export protein FliJ
VVRRPDSGLRVALEQRKRVFEYAQQALSERDRALQEELGRLMLDQSRVVTVTQQIDDVQRPEPGVQLPVALLGDLERLLIRCELQVEAQAQRVALARAETDAARGELAAAHQQVRALELVLEARAAERAEERRRAENRNADETAARVHSTRLAAARV